MLHLSEKDVRQLLPMPEAIRLMRWAFAEWREGRAMNQPRRRLVLPGGSMLHSLAGACGSYFGTKYYSTNPRHGAWFFFTLFDAGTGAPLAQMEANHLGQIRTGAASGYAASLLAAPDASVAAVIGSGFQARTQIEAVRLVRPIREVRVWSRSVESRTRFASEMNARAAASAAEAVRGAHIVIAATNAKEPVLDADWVHPGALVIAMGSNAENRRELPEQLIRRADVYVDSIEQARMEAGDIVLVYGAKGEWPNVRELRDLSGPAETAQAIRVFKSVGLGLEDVAAGGFVYEQAKLRAANRDSGQ